jgi:hypothetical protein
METGLIAIRNEIRLDRENRMAAPSETIISAPTPETILSKESWRNSLLRMLNF